MFLALRDLARSRRRFALVGAVVGLVAALSAVLAGLADGLVRDGVSGLRALPVTHFAFAPHSGAVFSRSTLDGRALAAWKRTEDVEVTPLGVSFVNATPKANGPRLDLALFGVDPQGFLERDSPAGRRGRTLPGLVLAAELRDRGARLGQRYEIGGSGVTLPVIGFTFGGSYGHVPIAYVSLHNWQAIAYGRDPRGRYSALALRAGPHADLQHANRVAATELVTKRQAYDGSPGFTAETATMTLIRGFLVVISALIVGAFFTVLTVQRTGQIGLLKAMGASSAYVVRDGLAQIAIVVTVATAAGSLLGAGLVAALSGGAVPVELSAGSVAASGAVLILAGTAGGLVACRRIAKVEPAIALEGWR